MATSVSHEALCPLVPGHGPAPHAAIMGHLRTSISYGTLTTPVDSDHEI